MRLFLGQFTRVRELGSIFLVAVGVALVSTLAGSVFDHVHQVDAEELTAATTTAIPTAGGNQVLSLKDWGLQLTMPLAAEMPAISYTTRPGDTVGLSSADLAPLGPTASNLSPIPHAAATMRVLLVIQKRSL